VLTVRRLPLGVALHTRRIRDPLLGEIVDDLCRNTVQRVGQEPPDIARRGQLKAEPKPVVITPATENEFLIPVVEEEESFERLPRRRTTITAEGHRFLIIRNSTGTATP
jgi:hypothetical protein